MQIGPSPQPTLPSASADPSARAARIAQRRDEYRYDFSYHGVCAIASLPLREEFSPAYIAKGAEVSTRLGSNRAAAVVEKAPLGVGSALGVESDPYARWKRMFPLLDEPASVSRWTHDWHFAWQRLAGSAPILLARDQGFASSIAIDPAVIRAALGRDATLASLAAEQRLFTADYALFDGVPGGETDGARKYLFAPKVLFVADANVAGGLAPLAIQCDRRGGASSLYTPADNDWGLAKFAAQVAEANYQGVLVHMGYCHEVIQRFVLAMHRQLSEEHPLAVLLAPHCEFTLAVNHVARTSVLAPDKTQDRLLAPALESQLALLVEGVRALDIDSLDPRIEFARRGVDASSALREYPFRDDGLLVWDAIERFVRGYVTTYYTSDDAVRADGELAAFVREVGADDGGRLPNMFARFEVKTIDALVALFARIVFRATAFHAAINNENYDQIAFAPAASTASFAGLPPRKTESASFLRSMLPPDDLCFEAISATWQVLALAMNRLGEYPSKHFVDPRVEPLVDAFRAELAAIEAKVSERNSARPMPYVRLLPSRINASITA